MGQEYWHATEVMFTSLIEKPRMTERLLSRPPFKYIFDIIMYTSKKTNFASGKFFLIQGCYEDYELEFIYYQTDSGQKSTKQKKIAYLERLISYVEMLTGRTVQACPSRIVAGLDPQVCLDKYFEKTNILLQEIYILATDPETMNAQKGIDLKTKLQNFQHQKNFNKYSSCSNLSLCAVAHRQKIVIFNRNKNELGDPSQNFSHFVFKYKSIYKLGVLKEQLTHHLIMKTHLMVFAGPTLEFSSLQILDILQAIQAGQRILILANQGGDKKNGTNLNALTELYGITINQNSIHPKSFSTHSYRNSTPKTNYSKDQTLPEIINLAYLNGTSLTVKPPSYPIISASENQSTNHPILAVYVAKSGGRLMVCGSFDMFSNHNIEQRDNQKLLDFALEFLLTNNINFDFSTSESKSEPKDLQKKSDHDVFHFLQ